MRRSIIHLVLGIALILSSRVQASKQGPKAPESPRVVSLAIEPSRLDANQKSYALRPSEEELTEGDGAALYNKAVQALPANVDMKQVQEWRTMPLRDLPQVQVQAVLQQAKTSLELVGQGAKCRRCNWPPFVSGTMPPNLQEYRHLAYLLGLKARLEMAQGQYEKSIETIRTGLIMAKHIGEAPTVIQGTVGVAMAGLMLQQMEDLAQAKGSPNLYPAMQSLPHPLIDLEVPMSSELKNLDSSKQYNVLVRSTMRRQLEDSFVRVRATMHRLDGHVAALQCVEALRHYAASHNGQLPKQLSEVTGVQIPDDPGTGKPFAYRYDGSKAVLEVSVPKGGSPRDGTRYEITVAR